MSVNLSTIGTYNSYQSSIIDDSKVANNDNESENQVSNQNAKMTAEEKLKQADEFWAQHDALYAEQQASVMNTITDGMRVAQEIYRRMASGAKVSQSDEQNLMQYDARMYMAAKNAQMMAQRKEDMSNVSLIEEFEKRHANDRKDWTTELDNKIAEMQKGDVRVNDPSILNASTETSISTSQSENSSTSSIDLSV